ncbi:hypothetical protein [Clostridium gasigenes]|uniref:Uncharacterized protein n=1 Tax=Clostridium gasigenes TaxID=94869 RepID=A0A7X0SG28_9CLOT|nr:hypothetical protein [Clostridium gasigenes]MBB6714911.1 hypothetical protein [Clostridium gasigenes]
MNLTINQTQIPIKYTNKELKNNKDENSTFEFNDKKISEEEDEKLYERYTKNHMYHSAFSFEDFKKNKGLFPPTTAPGIVRKVWREKLQNGTQEEKEAMTCFASNCQRVLNEKNGDVPNDLNGYLNFMGQMEKYMERYDNCPGVDKNFYESLVNVVSNIKTELEKYK